MAHPEILFHDNTLEYTFPLQPAKGGRVTLTLRARERDVTEALLCLQERNYRMKLFERRGGYDFFRSSVAVGEEIVRYYFHITFEDGLIRNYDRQGCYAPGTEHAPDARFKLIPGFKTPDWAKGAVFYQIFPDRFFNGDTANDVLEGEYSYLGQPVKKAAQWDALPSPTEDYRCFYGGDLQGVMDKLDYLKELGVDAVYLNPVFVSPSSHKYDTQDYGHVDPHLGRIVLDYGELPEQGLADNAKATRYICRTTHEENLSASDALLVRLIEKAHALGIRVILDGVFNHCGSFHYWMDRERIYEGAGKEAPGAYKSEESPYRLYFNFLTHHWPDNAHYEGWWNHETLPKLNYEASGELCEYILQIGRKWVSAPFFADGWRLDVAADLGHSSEFNIRFWQRFREAVKEANPEALIIAEHYGASAAWLDAFTWDTVMNYDGFMDPVSLFLTGMEKHSDARYPEYEGNHAVFWSSIRTVFAENFTTLSYGVAMNELSNHDHSRFLTRTNGVVGRLGPLTHEDAERGVRPEVFRQAVMMQFTWPGAPTVYYGDEASLCGFTDPDNRRTYPWGHEDTRMIAYHKELARLRHSCPELRLGSVKEVYSEHGLLSYGRFSTRVASLIVINRNDYALTRDFDVRIIGVPYECTMQRLLISTAEGFRTDVVDRHVSGGVLTLILPPLSAVIVRYDTYQPISKEEFWKHHFISFS